MEENNFLKLKYTFVAFAGLYILLIALVVSFVLTVVGKLSEVLPFIKLSALARAGRLWSQRGSGISLFLQLAWSKPLDGFLLKFKFLYLSLSNIGWQSYILFTSEGRIEYLISRVGCQQQSLPCGYFCIYVIQNKQLAGDSFQIYCPTLKLGRWSTIF